MYVPAWLKRLGEWFLEHEHFLVFCSLVLGHVFDYLTLGSPDGWYEHSVIVFYLTLTAVCIMVMHQRSTISKLERVPVVAIMQFAFGALAGSITVIYSLSGTLLGSALFFGLMYIVLISNEFLRSRYDRMYIHITVWFTLLVSYMALLVPILLGRIGDDVFIYAVAASIAVVTCLLMGVARIGGYGTVMRIVDAWLAVLLTAAVFLTLYFYNIIPPVPLSLKSVGVYHSIQKVSGDYLAQYETPNPLAFWLWTSTQYTLQQGQGAYCFSSVYAPVDLSTPIAHRWEYLNTVTDAWVTEAYVQFPISGGRSNGYRGYTHKTQLRTGTWRCSVETARGSLIGRHVFTVIEGESKIWATRVFD
jgi:Protein of unknown function (DUF2914)